MTGQTRQSLIRLQRVLEASGAGLEDVVSATVYLADDGWQRIGRALGAKKPRAGGIIIIFQVAET